jgi:hypothetical protein
VFAILAAPRVGIFEHLDDDLLAYGSGVPTAPGLMLVRSVYGV